MESTVKLFEPIQVRSLEIRNRIWIPPMCQYSCEQQNGEPNAWHQVHYGARATGGAGLIIAEASAVSPEGRISPWDTGIWNDLQVEAWRPVVDFVHSQGSKFAIQLAHAGRKGSTYREWSGRGSVPLNEGGWQTISATDEAFEGYAAPVEMSTVDVIEHVQKWVSAAKRAVAAGFDAIEIHAAHGYLLHQFLSPITNHRTDEYGGSLENRARLLLQIIDGIRATVPSEMPIFVRFSATDYVDGGFNFEQTAQVAAWCADRGADLFDISTGGLVANVQIPLKPGYQVPAAEFVSENLNEPVSAVGLITDPTQAEQILQNGLVEVVMIGRASLDDPMWPLHAAAALGVEVDYVPKQYQRSQLGRTKS